MSASAKDAFVVVAEFAVKQGRLDEFLAIARQDARDSVANEPGCQTFDVVQPEGSDGAVLLYEVYDDRAAFDAHVQSPHYAPFRDGTPALIEAEPVVRFCRRVG